jgi:hypothetical protein
MTRLCFTVLLRREPPVGTISLTGDRFHRPTRRASLRALSDAPENQLVSFALHHANPCLNFVPKLSNMESWLITAFGMNYHRWFRTLS